ncbi:MAG TPA: acyl-ACP--UDP-N-acetylglucosamine O-acyltransferase [Opitutaceae bacterium]|jgi:UDP-N-acetylglucosamine acyltransferase
MPSSIHPTAIVEPGALLGDGCLIHPGAIIKSGAILGERVVVHPYAVVGGDPQVLRFDPATPSGAKVGSGTIVREYTTINRSTEKGGYTVVGSNCLLMACSHVAHDSLVGDHAVIANNVLIAGHVTVGDGAVLGGGSAYHQFTRVGEGAIVGGLSRITLDIPPFVMAAERDEVAGLNLIGLRRRNVPRDAIREIKEAFRLVYSTKGNIREIASQALSSGEFKSAEAGRFLTFITGGTRGIARAARLAPADEEE